MVQSQVKDGKSAGAEERGTRGKEEEKEGKSDYSRWADYYCAAEKTEEGTGGQRRERKWG